MERRGFLKRLLGSAAIAVIASDVLKQIEEYEYVVEGKPRPKKLSPLDKLKKDLEETSNNTFIAGAGFWAIHEHRMVGWSEEQGVTLNMEQDPIEVTSMDTPSGMREFISGRMRATFQIDNLHIMDPTKISELFNAGETMDVVAAIPGTGGGVSSTFTGQGLITELNMFAGIGTGFPAISTQDEINASVRFQIVGALIRNDE